MTTRPRRRNTVYETEGRSKAQCINCHNGPLFTDQYFHNTGVPAAAGLPMDLGRTSGAVAVLSDEFNCRSPYSDASAAECEALEYLVARGPDLERAFKTPSLRNVAERAPYMHAGQLATLQDVLAHYSQAPAALIAFLRSLSAPLVQPAKRSQW